MHTLRQVEAEIQRQLVEHKVAIETILDDRVRRSEEAAFRRAEELFAPLMADLRSRYDEEVKPLRGRIEDVATFCREDRARIETRFEKDVASLNVEVASLYTAMPEIRGLLTVQAAAIKELEQFPPIVRAEVAEHREELRRFVEEMRCELANETRRAEGQEASIRRMLREGLDAMMKPDSKAVDPYARQEVSTVMHNLGIVEQRFLSGMAEIRDFVTLEAMRVANEILPKELNPLVVEALDSIQQRVDQGHERIELRSAAVETQMRGEFSAGLAGLLAKCERTADLKAAEVSMKLAEASETARRDLRSQAEQQHKLSQKWRDDFKDAMTRLESVAAAARSSSEEIHNHASQQLAEASSQLRREIDQAKQASMEDLKVLQKEVETKAIHIEMIEKSEAAQFSAEAANKRVGMLEVHYDRMKAWMEREATDLSQRCHGARNEANELQQRLQREHGALGGELSRVRAAATSLTHGVIKAFQVLGILSDCPPSRDMGRGAVPVSQRWGVDVVDLVEWEKTGRSLADRISEHWNSFAPVGASTLLSVLDQKATVGDVKMLRQFMTSHTSPRKSSGTPSTVAGLMETSASFTSDWAASGATIGSPSTPLPLIGSPSSPPSARTGIKATSNNLNRTM